MISVAWAVTIAVISGVVGILVAALVASAGRADAERRSEEWAEAHAKVSREYEKLDTQAQTLFGKLCKKQAENTELRREIAALKGEPRPGEPKAGGRVEEVASIIRDLESDGVVPAGHAHQGPDTDGCGEHFVTEMAATG